MLRLKYPNLFSTARRNAVEVEILRAQDDFEKANPSKYPSNIHSDGKPYIRYIHRVFLAFAREACELGSDGTWSMDRIQTECRLFFSCVVRGVLDFKAPDARWEPFFDGPLEQLTNNFGNGPEFAPYRHLLLGVAESSPAPEESPAGDTAPPVAGEVVALDPSTAAGPEVLAVMPLKASPNSAEEKPAVGTPVAYVFHQSESGWDVSFAGQTAHIDDLIGMKHIAELLRKPRVAIEAVRLVRTDNESAEPPQSAGLPMADAAAIRDVRKVLKERNSELFLESDWDKKEKLQEEISRLEKYLAEVEDHRGQPRLVASAADRSRIAVTMAVNRAIDRISQKLPTLATHLKDSVTTGTALTYNPSELPDWQF